jgi:hypothetical protein
VPAPFLTEVDATVPDAVATNQEGADLETVDLLDKGIEGCNLAGELSPQQSSLTFKNDRGDNRGVVAQIDAA